jgi:hypothetical protein
MKIAMVSVLEGRGEGRVMPFLRKHYGFTDGPGKFEFEAVDYEVVGGYLAHIRMPDKNTRSGEPYVLKPKISVLDYLYPLHSEDLAFYPGRIEGWRKTMHFIGEEDKLSQQLKDITVHLRNHFCPEDFNRDLGAALRHWFPDFEIP